MIHDEFALSLERYLCETLHNPVRLKALQGAARLPAFLERSYNFFDTHIVGRRCVILAAHDNIATPSEIAKHVLLVRASVDAVVVFSASFLTAHNRSRLISQGIAFVVPGNQLYIPELAMDLREHFRTAKPRQVEALSPAAQAVLFHYILRLDKKATTASTIAKHLRYSAMSIGRAFDDLAALQIAKTERRGKERHILFNSEGRKLLEATRKLLTSPVRTTRYITHLPNAANFKIAGESALAELTDLSKPQIKTYAVAASDWTSAAKMFGLIETDERETSIALETWSYDPSGLSNGMTVDPLSLYAQFSDHRDERIAMAAEKLLECIAW